MSNLDFEFAFLAIANTRLGVLINLQLSSVSILIAIAKKVQILTKVKFMTRISSFGQDSAVFVYVIN